jgi:hypothetical protein
VAQQPLNSANNNGVNKYRITRLEAPANTRIGTKPAYFRLKRRKTDRAAAAKAIAACFYHTLPSALL